MKTTMLGLAFAMLAAGCAHNVGGSQARAKNMRGWAVVDTAPRLLVAGPATGVHAGAESGALPTLFVVDQVRGDDSDCAVARAAHSTAARPGPDGRIAIPPGRALCAVAEKGSTEVFWHGRAEDGNSTMWALQ
jgi:hypothetical protein